MQKKDQKKLASEKAAQNFDEQFKRIIEENLYSLRITEKELVEANKAAGDKFK